MTQISERQCAALFTLSRDSWSPSWQHGLKFTERVELEELKLIESVWTWMDKTRPSVRLTRRGWLARQHGYVTPRT